VDVDSLLEDRLPLESVDEMSGLVFGVGALHEPKIESGNSCQAEVGLYQLPGDWRLASRLHLGTHCFCGQNVRHVFGEFDKAVKVIRVNDGGNPPTPESQVHRIVL
jgi:hypothetical protein